MMDDAQFQEMLAELDWIPAQRVHLRPGIDVRVRWDAYPRDTDNFHNGRVGEIIDIRGGDVIIRSNHPGRKPVDGAHYSPWVLEMKLDDCLGSPRIT